MPGKTFQGLHDVGHQRHRPEVLGTTWMLRLWHQNNAERLITAALFLFSLLLSVFLRDEQLAVLLNHFAVKVTA